MGKFVLCSVLVVYWLCSGASRLHRTVKGRPRVLRVKAAPGWAAGAATGGWWEKMGEPAGRILAKGRGRSQNTPKEPAPPLEKRREFLTH
jgi:hypothetical protein